MRSCLLVSMLLCAFASSQAQTTYLQMNIEDINLLDRLETRSGVLDNNLFMATKPISRKSAVGFLLEMRKEARGMNLSQIDRYNIDHAISVSGEWAPEEDGAIDSRRPILKTFYQKQPDLYHLKTKDFFLVVNPVISAIGMYQRGTGVTDNSRLASSRGAELRGWIGKKVGFYSYFTDNQEQPVQSASDFIDSTFAVPGAGYYTKGVSHYDYLLARGYIDFEAVKNHVNVTFGYDKHFIGDGYRSLFLSDFSEGATFLRLNTRIWKLNYQNLYLELTPQGRRKGDRLMPHKYATMHYLSANVTKWLNVGIFESVIFSRRDRYEFSYLVPIILYRSVERGLGSPDNVNLGINFKALVAKHLQFYGQLMLDEFKSKELFGGRGWWANKFGVQLGGKYYDAFTVKNLDLQGEINLVRPYTYTHNDSTSNYTHYNQALAHPLGAGFAEVLGFIRYQPVKNLYLSVKGMYYKQGKDFDTTNYGSNIFADYDTRSSDFGIGLINGRKTSTMLMNFSASYEVKENLFLDLGLTRRMFEYDNPTYGKARNLTYFSFGFRMNIAKRDYDFY
jgi:hypothetical protein